MGGRRGKEAGPQTRSNNLILTQESVFLGTDGIAFTPLGTAIFRARVLFRSLGTEDVNGREQQIEEDLKGICLDNGVEYSPESLAELDTHFVGVIRERWPSFEKYDPK